MKKLGILKQSKQGPGRGFADAEDPPGHGVATAATALTRSRPAGQPPHYSAPRALLPAWTFVCEHQPEILLPDALPGLGTSITIMQCFITLFPDCHLK